MSVSLVKRPQVGTFLTRAETGVAYAVVRSIGHNGHAYASIKASTNDGAFIVSSEDAEGWRALSTFRDATPQEVTTWYAVAAIWGNAVHGTATPSVDYVAQAEHAANVLTSDLYYAQDAADRLALEAQRAQRAADEVSADETRAVDAAHAAHEAMRAALGLTESAYYDGEHDGAQVTCSGCGGCNACETPGAVARYEAAQEEYANRY